MNPFYLCVYGMEGSGQKYHATGGGWFNSKKEYAYPNGDMGGTFVLTTDKLDGVFQKHEIGIPIMVGDVNLFVEKVVVSSRNINSFKSSSYFHLTLSFGSDRSVSIYALAKGAKDRFSPITRESDVVEVLTLFASERGFRPTVMVHLTKN